MKRFTSEQYKQYELKKNQRVRIEDLLQIYVDDIELQKEYLKFVIDTASNYKDVLEKITTLNLYHRLLESYLYQRQQNLTQKISINQLMNAANKNID